MNQPPLKTGFWNVVGLIGVVAGVTAVGMYALDWHSHTCEKCGHKWRHLGAFNVGDHESHTCRCGEIQWWKNLSGDGAFKTGKLEPFRVTPLDQVPGEPRTKELSK